MAPKQRMKVASEKHSQNIHARGNVPKSLVCMNSVYSVGANKCLLYTVAPLLSMCIIIMNILLCNRKPKKTRARLVLTSWPSSSSLCVDQVSYLHCTLSLKPYCINCLCTLFYSDFPTASEHSDVMTRNKSY